MAQPKRSNSESYELIPIPYQADCVSLYQAINHLPNAVWLDSGAGQGFAESRFDILTAEPVSLLTTRGQRTQITRGQYQRSSDENPFDIVAQTLAELPSYPHSELPFTGGALGYFGYHLNDRLEKLPQRPRQDVGIPDMVVGIYDWAIIQDHRLQQGNLLFLPSVCSQRRQQLSRIVANSHLIETSSNSFYINELTANCNVESYHQKLARIHNYILSGDAYQVSFAQRFEAEYRGAPLSAYLKLRQLLPAPYSAFLNFREGTILSHSPELFLQTSADQVTTKPIKGTRPRSGDPHKDKQLLQELLNSAKDKAENLMIVDLLRNDLGKHCVPGSIHVTELCGLNSYQNVHHLVSTVVGQLQRSSTGLDLLRDSFPGGSITGAPKIRAMEIINELEEQERSTYCGSIGYISTNQNMCTNIAIRTLVANQERIYGWAGGGIVADSNAEEEYQECLAKIGILLDGLPRKQSK